MNLNKKTIIQLVIIVVAFGCAGLVIYNGFFSGGSTSGAIIAMPGGNTPRTSQDILPYGQSDFDFTAITSRPFVFNQYQFQTLDPNTEVGISPDSMITNPQ